MIECIKADTQKFAVFHTAYTDSNIFARFDWNERVSDAIYCTENSAFFIYEDQKIIGGFTLKNDTVSYPFMVVPFSDRIRFWNIVLEYVLQVSGNKDIFLNEIPEVDVQTLTQSFGATVKLSKRNTFRPTEQFDVVLSDEFYFDNLTEKDKPEIIEVIFEAHAAGYTSTVTKPDMAEIQNAVERRFNLFGQTDTLAMGNLVKSKKNHEIAGVCIAGIYPDSPNNFSTIHQVSVKPTYQRKGIARAMMLKAIHEASSVSPIITLGVMIGNPAEILYREMGFVPGPSYSQLVYAR